MSGVVSGVTLYPQCASQKSNVFPTIVDITFRWDYVHVRKTMSKIICCEHWCSIEEDRVCRHLRQRRDSERKGGVGAGCVWEDSSKYFWTPHIPLARAWSGENKFLPQTIKWQASKSSPFKHSSNHGWLECHGLLISTCINVLRYSWWSCSNTMAQVVQLHCIIITMGVILFVNTSST